MYKQLSLRMIRLLVALEHGWALKYEPQRNYYWAGTGRPEPQAPHWATINALLRRDMLHAHIELIDGAIVYQLTDQARLYLKEQARRTAETHP